MAYAAVISLSNTIHRLLNHNRISISLKENQQLLSLLEHVNFFETFLENFPDKVNGLEGRIRELAHEAEDMIECFMSEQASSWPNYQTEEVIRRLKLIGLPSHKVAMVGYEDYAMDLKDRLCGEPSKLQVIPICGMPGTGKTTLAKHVYDDPLIVDNFVIRVWITILHDYSAQRILSSLFQTLKEFGTDELGQSEEEKVHTVLMGRRYLVVMDDIWSTKVWDVVKKVFPDDGNGSRIMITTRLSYMASYPDPSTKLYQMGLLNEDQSWDLFKRNVFGDEECPSELENTGKDIARCCRGWPLALVKIAGILSTTDRNCALWKKRAEDTLKYLELEKGFPSGCHPSEKHELCLEEVMEEIGLIARDVRGIKDKWSSHDVQRGAAASSALRSSSKAPPIPKDVMVGFEDYVLDLKNGLCGEPSKKLHIIPICGMGGIGKTTLARHVYYDPLIIDHFVIRVWVTISQDYSAERILSSIVQSLKEFNIGGLGQNNDEKVHKILMGRRYLVVMDDIWSTEAWDVVRRVFPDDGNGSRVMLTTRLSDVASYPDPSTNVYEMSLLNAHQSWKLLKQKVFADGHCGYDLKRIGKRIARSCKGLPLAIVVIAGLLSTTMRNRVSWKVIAENMKSAEIAEHNQIEDILSLSYVQLPQYLRPCFLYMASFPEDDEIRVKKLIKLWVAEGFVKTPIGSDSFEKVAEEFLEELVKRNLVIVTKRKWDGRIKRCSLHDMMWDLCIRKSHESKFFLSLMDRRIGSESFVEKVRNERRVSVDSSNLEFFSSLQGSTIRSIKCSRKHSGRLDFLESVRLLRVLDAEPLNVYELPTLVHLDELFHLRYLAIRCYGDIPASFSMLQNLQTLVIHRETRAKVGVLVTSDLVLTWYMSRLRHVYYHGTIHFHDPEETALPLESLQTLSYVSHSTCRERILKMIPNMKRLQINCSKGLPSDGGVCLDDLVHLHRLENLEMYAGEQVKYYKITFPTMVKKLILRHWKLPWNDIFVFGSFPNLQVLKLIRCTCVGGTWETTEGTFPVLEVLKISDSRFENWVTESSHFPRLKLLVIHDCEDLNGIPNDIGDIPTLELIEVKGVGRKSLIESVEAIREEQEYMGNDNLQVICTAKPNFNSLSYDDDEDD